MTFYDSLDMFLVIFGYFWIFFDFCAPKKNFRQKLKILEDINEIFVEIWVNFSKF